MSEGKECRFFWGIHITTQAHSEVLKIIECLDSYVHKATNPVIEGTHMWVFKLFNYYPIRGVSMKISFSNAVSIGKGDFWNLTSYFYLFQIFLDDVFDDMTCLINTDSISTLDDINIEDIYFWEFLGCVIKESIKLLHQSLKENPILFCHEDIICFRSKKNL